MNLFGILRAPRELLFGAGQRHALGSVAATLGRRARHRSAAQGTARNANSVGDAGMAMRRGDAAGGEGIRRGGERWGNTGR